MAKSRFLFEEYIEIGFDKRQVKVHVVPDEIYFQIYECVIDNEETYEIAREFDGRWFDNDSGSFTNMAEIIGNIIDSKGL